LARLRLKVSPPPQEKGMWSGGWLTRIYGGKKTAKLDIKIIPTGDRSESWVKEDGGRRIAFGNFKMVGAKTVG